MTLDSLRQQQHRTVNAELHQGVKKRSRSSRFVALFCRAAIASILAAAFEGRYGISHRDVEFRSLLTQIKHHRNNVRRQAGYEPPRRPVKTPQIT